MFYAGKTRMIWLPYGEKNCDDRFHLIPERFGQTDGRTDGQTDRFAISISRVSILTRDKNYKKKYPGWDTVLLPERQKLCPHSHFLNPQNRKPKIETIRQRSIRSLPNAATLRSR